MRRATAVVILLLAGLCAAPVQAAAPGPAVGEKQPAPATLGCEGLQPATPIPGDLNPDGSRVRTSLDERGRYVPVVFVHGWTSRSTHVPARTGAFSSLMDLSTNRVRPVSVPRSLIGQVQRIPGVEAFTFDYEPWSARWATDDRLGPRLGRAIDCLYDKTGEKVVVVAHSMGGLLTRYAAAQPVDGAPDRSGRISNVITFGSPQNGSAVAQAVVLGLDGAALASRQAALLRLILADCGAQTTRQLATGSLCDWLPGFIRAFDSEAGRGLRLGSKELKALPPFPKGLPVDALAGETDLRVPRAGWFALPWDTDSVPMGDMIVLPSSARSGSTLSRSAACAYQLSAVRGATDQLGLLFQQTSKTDVAAQPLGTFTGPCFHTSLMRTVELTNEVAGLISEDIDSRQVRDLTVEDLRQAPVPSLCEHAAGRLVDGVLPGLDPSEGEVGLVDAQLGDLDGDGKPEGIALLRCTYGGNADYVGVHVYRRGPTYVDRADLEGDRVVQRSRGISYGDVRVVNGLLEVTGYDGDGRGDGTAGPSVVLSKRFALIGDRLVVQRARPPGLSDPITPDGWGSVIVDVTYEVAARNTGWAVDVDAEPDSGCAYVQLEGAPGGVDGMGDDERLYSLDTAEPGVRTSRGVGVGSTEAQVLAAYGPAARRVPNEYVQTDDVVVGRARVLRFQFSDDTGRVVSLHAGEEGWAMLIEGCA